MESVLFQTSIIAAFVAGIVALFAPCCITFLLPAYLGSVFKEKEKVLAMTLVFGLGIWVTLLPAVIGVAIVSRLLFRYHEAIYIIGALVMFGISAITLLGIKLPMPQIRKTAEGNKTDVGSIFIMGVLSGITSACCAPVLVGVLTLTFLSPSFFGALLIGTVYVIGMVTPLLLISLFLDNKADKFTAFKRPIYSISLVGKTYLITLGNAIASAIFALTGILSIKFITSGAENNMEQFTKMIQQAGWWANEKLGSNPYFNFVLLITIVAALWFIVRRASKK